MRCPVDREVMERRCFGTTNLLKPMPSRKASSENIGARTANRHWWVGRVYQGERETLR